MKLKFTLALLFAAPSVVFAAYDENMSGVIEGIYAYADTSAIYIKLKNQPSSHPACSPAYFVIDGSVPEDRRNMMFSRLLTAYAAKEAINIGYDSKGNCAEGYIRVHRAG